MPNQAIELTFDWKRNRDIPSIVFLFTDSVKNIDMAKSKAPEMVQDLHQEWRRFCRQAMCILEGPLHGKEDSVKVSHLKMWVGDKGLDVFEGFTFANPGDAVNLKVVVQKLEEYCAVHERCQGDRELQLVCNRSEDSRKILWISGGGTHG